MDLMVLCFLHIPYLFFFFLSRNSKYNSVLSEMRKIQESLIERPHYRRVSRFIWFLFQWNILFSIMYAVKATVPANKWKNKPKRQKISNNVYSKWHTASCEALLSRRWKAKAHTRWTTIYRTTVDASAKHKRGHSPTDKWQFNTVSVDIRATLWPSTLMHGLPFISCCHTGAAIRGPSPLISSRSLAEAHFRAPSDRPRETYTRKGGTTSPASARRI